VNLLFRGCLAWRCDNSRIEFKVNFNAGFIESVEILPEESRRNQWNLGDRSRPVRLDFASARTHPHSCHALVSLFNAGNRSGLASQFLVMGTQLFCEHPFSAATVDQVTLYCYLKAFIAKEKSSWFSRPTGE
jgi:hypothetical protein